MKRDQRTGQLLFHGKQDALKTCVGSSINCVLTLYTWHSMQSEGFVPPERIQEVHHCLHDVDRIVLHDGGQLRLCRVGASVSHNDM